MPDSDKRVNELETILESIKLTEEQEKSMTEWYVDKISEIREQVSEELKAELEVEFDTKLQESLEVASKEMKEALTESLTEQLTDEITEYVIDEMENVYGAKFQDITSNLNRVYENKLIGMLNGLKKELREQVEEEFKNSGEYQAFQLMREAIEPFIDLDGQSVELKKQIASLQNENSELKKENGLGKVNETILRLTSKITDEKIKGFVKESLEDCKTVEEVLDSFDRQLKLAKGLKEATEQKLDESLKVEKKQISEGEQLSYEEYKFLQESKKIKTEPKKPERKPPVISEAMEPETQVTPVVENLEEGLKDNKVVSFREKMKKLAGTG